MNIASIVPGNSPIQIIINDDGGNYIPAYNINTIDNIDNTEGYFVYSPSSTSFDITGTLVNKANQTFQYKANRWNWIGFLSNTELSIETEFASIKRSISIIIDDAGASYIPDYSINTIGNMQPGKGYMLYVKGSNDITHTFPKQAPGIHIDTRRISRAPAIPGSNFHVTSSGMPYHVVVEMQGTKNWLKPGDEIGIFDGEQVVGSAVVTNYDVLDIVTWEKDTEHSLPGFTQGNQMRLVQWSKEMGEIEPLEVTFVQGGGIFGMEGYTVVRLSGNSGIIDSYTLSQNYPNPFNPETTINYSILNDGQVTIAIYSITGQLVRTIVNNYQSKGTYSIV